MVDITPQRRPRLSDIAERTGLSIKTVSRAMRGEAAVREATRALVLAEAERIGFRHDDIAAGLRRKDRSTATVGVTLGDLGNPFFAAMLGGIQEVAAEHGHLVLSSDAHGDPALEQRAIQAFFAHRAAGVIVAPTGDDLGYLEREIAFGAAVVFVDSPPPGLHSAVDAVVTTNVQSTREGIAVLIARGHRRIAYLGHPRRGSGALERWTGYREALEAAGLPVDDALVRHDLVTEADTDEAARSLLTGGRDAPTAVFADNIRLSQGLLLSAAYRRAPVDVMGFDESVLATVFGASTIDSRPAEVGRAGARLLFDRLAERGRPARREVVTARLTVRTRR